VAQFTARPVNSQVQLTIDDQAAADTRANSKTSHGIDSLAGAKLPLADRDGAHIVEQSDGQFSTRVFAFDLTVFGLINNLWYLLGNHQLACCQHHRAARTHPKSQR
jgi:hypothetical protein